MANKEYEQQQKITLTKGNLALVRKMERSGEWGHIQKECEVVRDVVAVTAACDDLDWRGIEKGDRIIILRERDMTAYKKKITHVTNLLMKAIGSKDATLRGYLRDTIGEYLPKELEIIRSKIEDDGEVVKPKEGCFKLVIGDGRKKGHYEIPMRD